ncbi:HDOD domain-containing protein [Phycisphaeraceae bacterium D3-23]
MSMTSLGGDLKGSVRNLTQERVLACESLPTLPTVAMELLQKTSNPDVAINEIAELIQSDPGLAGKVLKTVNSSFYGLPKPCPSIDRAIGMLGLRAVKSLVLGFSMVNLSQDVSDGFDMAMFWRRTIIAAAGARQVATLAKTCEPDEAFAAALFQDMGMLAIFVTEPEAYSAMVDHAGVFHNNLYKAEQKQLGFDHATIGAELAKRWRMPDQIVEAIRHHHRAEEAEDHTEVVRVVALGVLAARCVVEEGEGPAFSELLEKANGWYGWHPQDLTAIIEKTTAASKEVARLLGQGIGEMPDPQQLLATANQRLVEQQIMVQRESEGFQKQAEQYEQAATTDGLTGIANRKRFDDVAEEAMATATGSGQPIAVLFSDADKFKFVNDTYGHHAGDLVLIELANRLVQTVGAQGTVCRYGGEEFAIVLPGATLETATQVGEAMRRAIADRPFELADVPDCPDELPRTVSVGVAAWAPGLPQVSAQELVQRADKAVYLAKESGRNNVKRWGVDLGDGIPAPAVSTAPAPAVPTTAPIASTQSNNTDGDEMIPDLSPDAGPKHVLVVEDDALASRLMKMHFEKHSEVQAKIAGDGREAVQMLRDAQRPGQSLPDLIVCDVNMPGFTGLQILKALKANPVFSSIPIVMVTATEDGEARQACQDAGAMGVFSKTAISETMETWCQSMLSALKLAS